MQQICVVEKTLLNAVTKAANNTQDISNNFYAVQWVSEPQFLLISTKNSGNNHNSCVQVSCDNGTTKSNVATFAEVTATNTQLVARNAAAEKLPWGHKLYFKFDIPTASNYTLTLKAFGLAKGMN